MLADFEKVLDRLKVASRKDDKAMALCPAHDDKSSPSLSIKAEDGKLLLHCFAGCKVEEIIDVIGLKESDLFADDSNNVVPFRTKGGGGVLTPLNTTRTLEHSAGTREDAGCTLADYAAAKKLPVEFLRGLGLSDLTYMKLPAVKVSYPDEHGQECAVRFRVSLNGGDKFRWRSGDKPVPYGLPLLEKAREAAYAVLVEGESDCHALWLHDVPALGIPGASNWRNEWSGYLDGVGRIFVVVEPDEAGEKLWEELATSELRDRLYRVEFDGAKDASELHLQEPERFKELFWSALQNAPAWTAISEAATEAASREAWKHCEALALEPDILEKFATELTRCGVAGESKLAKLLYLAVTSRLLPKPVSVAVKGPSSGGKSYVTERVLDYFPDGAYYSLTAMSEHALAYSEEPLVHRMLVIYEAAGMTGDFASYLMRSLLSEGKLKYETVQKTSDGMEAKLIEREGPTGLIVTTTATRLHPENETRLISLLVTDTRDQTRDVLAALADEAVEEADPEPWFALQTWLIQAEHRVTIPYAKVLAGMVPPVAVRLRRDFGAVLNLVRAHAVLHQTNRREDASGRVIATLEDYAKVRELVADLVSEGVGATVPPIVRETVETVERLLDEGDGESVSSRELGVELKLEGGTISRRVRMATDAGYLKNLEDRRGKPSRLILGDAMPDDLTILPTVRELRDRFSVSSVSEGVKTPPPPYVVNENDEAVF